MKYFEFPIILIDNNYEMHRREKAVTEIDSSTEYAIGILEIAAEAQLIKIADSWLPTEEDFVRAQDGDFTACTVTFDGLGTYEVPMTRDKFKKMYNKFKDKLDTESPKVEVIHLKSKDELINFLKNIDNEQENQPESKSE